MPFKISKIGSQKSVSLNTTPNNILEEDEDEESSEIISSQKINLKRSTVKRRCTKKLRKKSKIFKISKNLDSSININVGGSSTPFFKNGMKTSWKIDQRKLKSLKQKK